MGMALEDCMEERQHHLNESSSARLRRSQKMEILPSPNSKSLGANFLMDAYILDMHIYFGHAHIFWTCAYILDMRIYFGHAYIFWTCANILDMRIYFRHLPIFWESAYILDKRTYSEQALTFWADANILCIREYFRQVPIIDDFCSKFCLVWFLQ